MSEIKQEQYKEIDLIQDIQVLQQEPLKNHTTFRIGGPADRLITAYKAESIAKVILCCKRFNIPYFILGNGSDLLFSDEGFRGVVVKLIESPAGVKMHVNENATYVTADAGILLSKLSYVIAEQGLKGFEFAAGIPGSLGGAIYMNAGAYGGEIKDCIVSATVMMENGQLRSLNKDELELSYRSSILQEKKYLVLDATLLFSAGDKQEIRNRIEEWNQRRREKQPLEYPSAGSTFKRPEGYFAGKLIMDSGLAGYRVGDAMVSQKHCGFVINCGNATSRDVKQVIADVIQTVKEKFGVTLEPEVRIIEDEN